MSLLTFLIGFSTLLGGIVKLPPVAEEPVATEAATYEQLTCTEEDRENIYYIISTMAENGKLTLLFQYKSDLTRRGVEIAHVHPLKFLGTIFSDPNLKECMQRIYPDYFKRTKFMNDLGESLTNRMDRGQLEPYLEEFAKEVCAPVEAIRGYAQSRDWDGLLQFLLNH
jgi:hypothetical protein